MPIPDRTRFRVRNFSCTLKIEEERHDQGIVAHSPIKIQFFWHTLPMENLIMRILTIFLERYKH